jgi:hypothetical protein
MDRRAFISMIAAGSATALLQRTAHAQPVPKVQNVVFVHGLFADGSCWSEVIARLQPKGIQVMSVQNPLTTLKASVEATQRALVLQQGPTVLLGHRAKKVIHMMRKGHHTDDPTLPEPQEDARAQKANRQRAERASAGGMIAVQPLPTRRKLWFEDIASLEIH